MKKIMLPLEKLEQPKEHYEYDGLTGLWLWLPWWAHLSIMLLIWPLFFWGLPNFPFRHPYLRDYFGDNALLFALGISIFSLLSALLSYIKAAGTLRHTNLIKPLEERVKKQQKQAQHHVEPTNNQQRTSAKRSTGTPAQSQRRKSSTPKSANRPTPRSRKRVATQSPSVTKNKRAAKTAKSTPKPERSTAQKRGDQSASFTPMTQKRGAEKVTPPLEKKHKKTPKSTKNPTASTEKRADSSNKKTKKIGEQLTLDL